MSAFKKILPYLLLAVLTLVAVSAAQTAPAKKNRSHMPMMPGMVITKAIAVLNPASGSQVHGTVTFEKVTGGIKVVADVEGLTPGEHGFHVHQYGDCSSSDATSAGDHFNPMNMPHGSPTDAKHHSGDMGNINAGADGKAHMEMTDSTMSFFGPESIIGRAVIVHGGADDMKSQPSGNSGPRVACGVIGIAK